MDAACFALIGVGVGIQAGLSAIGLATGLATGLAIAGIFGAPINFIPSGFDFFGIVAPPNVSPFNISGGTIISNH